VAKNGCSVSPVEVGVVEYYESLFTKQFAAVTWTFILYDRFGRFIPQLLFDPVIVYIYKKHIQWQHILVINVTWRSTRAAPNATLH